jgi:hypothetical protein
MGKGEIERPIILANEALQQKALGEIPQVVMNCFIIAATPTGRLVKGIRN